MKISIVIIIAGISSCISFAQVTITNKGTAITNSSSSIYVCGSFTNDVQGKIANGARIYISGDLINNSTNALFVTKAGKLIFNGNSNQNIAGLTPINFFGVDLNKTSGKLLLQQNISINDSLKLLNGNIDLNSFNINLGGTGYLAFENTQNRVYGNSGAIRALRLFQHPVLSDNVAGLGLFISSKDNFDSTWFERGHAMQRFAGDSSILRYYNFIPSAPGYIDTLKLSYLDSETIPDEFLYKLLASENDGTDWKNKGGIADTSNNFVLSTTVSPPDVTSMRFSVFPNDNFATCLPNDPDYISAVFLASSMANNGDSLKFVQLSESVPQSYSWSFGDGSGSSEESPYHVYRLPTDTVAQTYSVSMTISNGICSDTRRKNIEILPSNNTMRSMSLFHGISMLNIFPNPHSGIFNIEIGTTDVSDITLDVIDAEGYVLRSMTGERYIKEEVNIDQLSPGLYFLKILAGNELRVVKVMKL